MNILLLTHSYPDSNNRYRGIFVQEQARALSSVHNVTVIYFRTDYSKYRPFAKYSFTQIEESNPEVYEVVTGRSFPVINQLKYLIDTFSFIEKEILSRKKIDLIHSHLAYPAGFLGTWISRKKHIPQIFTEHTSIRKYYRSLIHKLCVRYALLNSPGIICVSNSLKKELLAEHPRQIEVVPNVIDTSEFEIADRKQDAKINIGFLASLNTQNKGLDLLLRAVASIGHEKFNLHIGGKGALLEDYKKMSEQLGITGICKFYGEVLNEEKKDFYSGLDFFVLSSRYETFGIVLIEAMAGGLPVIATKCGGPEDIVVPRVGILVEKDDVPGLASAISEMATNLRHYDRQMIRTFTEQNFGRAAFLKRVSVIYNTLTSNEQEN